MASNVEITWLGHGTFLITTPEGKRLLVDPWLAGNPSCPGAFHDLDVDAILITHGHGDHIGDIFTAHARCAGPIIGMFDLTTWLGIKGVPGDKLVGMNKGGRIQFDELALEVVMTDARHSSSFTDGDQIVYLGEPAGFVLGFSNGQRLYVAGDTSVFGDMALIKRLERPTTAILPIGDRFTMDPKAAAVACELLGVEAVIPAHWGTFGLLTGTPDALRAELSALGLSTRVLELEPGAGTTLS
jgi:L-ascorbate metabolism protein UlaG (beta-lactamase superfamily)